MQLVGTAPGRKPDTSGRDRKGSCQWLMLALFLSILGSKNTFGAEPRIIERRGGKVSVVKFENGTWQLQVENKPYFIKGVVFVPVKIGESPEEATMRDWMTYDDNHNGKNDIAYETWLYNDQERKPIGDFQLLKEMGANTIRLYHVASDNRAAGDVYEMEGTDAAETALQFNHPLNKALLRSLYRDFGIRVIMGNFLGSWTIGSGVTWTEGTDYTNPKHCENIKKSVRAMVLDSKDEPYVLMWMLGNENNIADWSRCNAKTQPEAYAKLIGELAEMIHKLDPEHPVAVCNGDDYHHMLRDYARYAPGIDVVAYNAYRGVQGFGNLWSGAKKALDRPVMISEFGPPAYNKNTGEDQEYQLRYIKGCWKDIVLQSADYIDPEKGRIGNSIGGTVFDWVDRWYRDGSPSEHNPGTQPFSFADGIMHQEWWGLMAMDDGPRHDSLMRRPRKAYVYLKGIWNQNMLVF